MHEGKEVVRVSENKVSAFGECSRQTREQVHLQLTTSFLMFVSNVFGAIIRVQMFGQISCFLGMKEKFVMCKKLL